LSTVELSFEHLHTPSTQTFSTPAVQFLTLLLLGAPHDVSLLISQPVLAELIWYPDLHSERGHFPFVQDTAKEF
jgi:hypothetical protein